VPLRLTVVEMQIILHFDRPGQRDVQENLQLVPLSEFSANGSRQARIADYALSIPFPPYWLACRSVFIAARIRSNRPGAISLGLDLDGRFRARAVTAEGFFEGRSPQ